MNKQELKNAVRNYVTAEVFSGTMPEGFNDDTKIISTRLMDSIVTLNMVNHFEERLGIQLQAHDVSVDNLDSVNMISSFLSTKAGLSE
ncbi:MAG: acyl carrier protein [Bacteroidetes bacterium]|nr:acyl carrier protein [Bacteroidota bacterium]